MSLDVAQVPGVAVYVSGYGLVRITADRCYGDGTPALIADDGLTGKVSTWLEEAPGSHCIWAETAGFPQAAVDALLKAGVIEATGRDRRSGFKGYAEYRLGKEFGL